MGGEKPNRILWDNFKKGSPPHGRGKDSPEIIRVTVDGITPAWAGKSNLKHFAAVTARDHPRMGGEKASPRAQKGEAVGSPPHGRGKGMQ